eukprot:TRINITY_DN3602_c0_g1_i5.p1 TRINITY_DN3602_c0_g1~~TRINITY_DN3602_c0_g1_i5.p1  ORF type:complete len:857 (-),score=203.25 TRINITY_DN3602_c0_g1_i5:196-2766(-)
MLLRRVARRIYNKQPAFCSYRNAQLNSEALPLTNSLSSGGRFFSSSPSDSHTTARSINELSKLSAASKASGSVVSTKEQDVIVRLLLNIGSHKEVRQYLKHFANVDTLQFAIIKIGGGVLEESLPTLVSSLTFLQRVGLFPIVIHGGGPQMNDELDRAGIPAEYTDGLRITSPEVLAIAQRIFQRENLKLVDALEQAGARARPVTAVFESEILDQKKYGLVGKVSRINSEGIASCILSGCVPVLSSLGVTPNGQILNINADVAALELAKEIRPLKIIFLNTTAGMKDDKGQLMQTINLAEDYDYLMAQPWVKYGLRLKIKEMKACLDTLPLSSSISVTSPEHLQEELFSNKGSGTHVLKGEKINVYSDLSQVDLGKLKHLIEDAFGKPLVDDYFETLSKRIYKIYLSQSFRAVAILTKENGIPYLDKFAATENAKGDGLGETIWARLISEHKQLFWRSRNNNSINPWYFQKATGHIRDVHWTIFWYGIEGIDNIRDIVAKATSLPPTMQQPTAGKTTQAKINLVVPSKPFRVGLLGARGYVGSHLTRLISKHPHLELACVGSSSQIGQSVSASLPDTPKHLKFQDITPDNISKFTENEHIDAWFLALPDQISPPYVSALNTHSLSPLLIDISADHRFNPAWVYGQPEVNRSKIRGAKRIANPGCYATGMFLTMIPLLRDEGIAIEGIPSFFGVSGFSGSGTKPSPRNDPVALKDNIIPYKVIDHTHQAEVSHQAGANIFFTPHVAPYFQGITLTASIKLRTPLTNEELYQKYANFYKGEPLIKVTPQIPLVRDNVNKHTVSIGGFAVDPQTRHAVVITTLDNLLKGAATQALQNLNVALGMEELLGIKEELETDKK